jgi:hypothetical protein
MNPGQKPLTNSLFTQGTEYKSESRKRVEILLRENSTAKHGFGKEINSVEAMPKETRKRSIFDLKANGPIGEQLMLEPGIKTDKSFFRKNIDEVDEVLSQNGSVKNSEFDRNSRIFSRKGSGLLEKSNMQAKVEKSQNGYYKNDWTVKLNTYRLSSAEKDQLKSRKRSLSGVRGLDELATLTQGSVRSCDKKNLKYEMSSFMVIIYSLTKPKAETESRIHDSDENIQQTNCEERRNADQLLD